MDIRAVAAATALVAVTSVTGCGSSGDQIAIRTPASRPPRPTGTTPAPSSSTASSPTGKRNPTVTITPDTGLTDGQTVTVTGSQFSPNERLSVVECADKGSKTGPNDCNIGGIIGVATDQNGSVTTRFTVVKGPFGGNKIVCSAQQPCLVSVSQASLSPTEEADARIHFAGG